MKKLSKEQLTKREELIAEKAVWPI